MKTRIPVLVVLTAVVLGMLFGCGAPSQQSSAEVEQSTETKEIDAIQDEDEAQDEAAASSSSLDAFGMPPEIRDLFEGHELSLSNNPLLGTYTTTSGCVMVLMEDGSYSWQDTPDTPALTGKYFIYEGSLDGRSNTEAYSLESDTGPLYTVFVLFDKGQGASDFTVQVFDYQNNELYYVSDLVNGIWFEANKTS